MAQKVAFSHRALQCLAAVFRTEDRVEIVVVDIDAHLRENGTFFEFSL